MFFVFKEKSVSSLAGRLFEADGAGGVGGPVLGRPYFTGWLLGDWELASVVPDHRRRDLHLVEGLAVVDWTPTMLRVMSGRMIMLRRCVDHLGLLLGRCRVPDLAYLTLRRRFGSQCGFLRRRRCGRRHCLARREAALAAPGICAAVGRGPGHSRWARGRSAAAAAFHFCYFVCS